MKSYRANQNGNRVSNKNQKGYTLLEYCAGAAIIAGVLWVALSNLGNDLSGLLGNVGQWARTRGSEIQAQ